MNERIFKLALKAMDFQGAVDIDTELKMTNSELAKFAELIVQECIDIIAPYTVRMSRPGEEYLHPILEIKEHFGVEQ